MKILLAPPILKRLRRELRRAGNREIGGLLMGEDLGNGDFRVVEISVQRSGGTEACFIRNPKGHQTELDTFFARTGNNYSRFNYLGEWHSHPSFTATPSAPDLATMLSLVNDPSVGSNFWCFSLPGLLVNKSRRPRPFSQRLRPLTFFRWRPRLSREKTNRTACPTGSRRFSGGKLTDTKVFHQLSNFIAGRAKAGWELSGISDFVRKHREAMQI